MNGNTVDLHIPSGENMRLVARLATVGYIASTGLTLDEAEDMKIARVRSARRRGWRAVARAIFHSGRCGGNLSRG